MGYRQLMIAIALLAAGGGIWMVAELDHFAGKTAAAPQATTAVENTIPIPATASGAAELGLARHLRSVGAKMYGAYWCPHCHDQLSLFGKDAARLLTYIECAEDGKTSQTELCRKAGVRGFPTWVIQGKTYEGTQSLPELAQASGYRGAQNFKNSSR